MYPIFRMGVELLRTRRQTPLGFFDKHISTMRVWPWDLDIFLELNNGRTLTLYDIPRIGLSARTGLLPKMKRANLRFTIAGSSVQYRKRITLWQKLDISAQCIGADERFIYMEQIIHRDGEPVGQALLRAAIVRKGLVTPKDAFAEMGYADNVPELPEWAIEFAAADHLRPWPPKPATTD